MMMLDAGRIPAAPANTLPATTGASGTTAGCDLATRARTPSGLSTSVNGAHGSRADLLLPLPRRDERRTHTRPCESRLSGLACNGAWLDVRAGEGPCSRCCCCSVCCSSCASRADGGSHGEIGPMCGPARRAMKKSELSHVASIAAATAASRAAASCAATELADAEDEERRCRWGGGFDSRSNRHSAAPPECSSSVQREDGGAPPPAGARRQWRRGDSAATGLRWARPL